MNARTKQYLVPSKALQQADDIIIIIIIIIIIFVY